MKIAKPLTAEARASPAVATETIAQAKAYTIAAEGAGEANTKTSTAAPFS